MDDNLIWSAFEMERFNKCLLVYSTKILNCGCDNGMGMNLSCKDCEYYRQTGIV